MKFTAMVLLLAGMIAAQAPVPQPPAAQTPAQAEIKELTDSLTEVGNSSVDVARVLEQFLKKYPQTIQKKQIERALAHAAVENKDDTKTILYGERALVDTPDDMLLLDRVARARLALGGRENAEKSLQYSRAFEMYVKKAPVPAGRDAGRKQEERDRGLSRALLYQVRAKIILGDKAEAERLAGEAYHAYPSEEAAREWAAALENAGQRERHGLTACRRFCDSGFAGGRCGSSRGSPEARRFLSQTPS